MKSYNRIEKARMIADLGLAAILQRDNQGRAREVIVPGTDGKQYSVLISRNGAMKTECRLLVGNNGYKPCRGENHTVCTHSLTALVLAAREVDCEILGICTTMESAERIQRIYKHSRALEISPRFSTRARHVWLITLRKDYAATMSETEMVTTETTISLRDKDRPGKNFAEREAEIMKELGY